MTYPKLRLNRSDWAVAAVLSVLSLAVYTRTLAPGLLYGDSAELQTLSALPGMTHPTGYPVYILIGWVFGHLPFGDVAYNVNLMSTFFAAVTIGLLYLAGVVLIRRRRLPAVGAVAFAASYTFWSQAIIAELYAIAAAFIVAILLLLLCWHNDRNPHLLLVAGLLGGLSLGVHLTVALMAPAVVVFLMVSRADRRSWKQAILGGCGGLVVVFAAFVVLDWADSEASFYNAVIRPSLSVWSLSPDQFDSLWERTLFQLSAEQFRSQMFSLPLSDVVDRVGDYWDQLRQEFGAVALILSALGFVASWIRSRQIGLLLALTFATHLIYDLNYDIYDIAVFYIPTYLIIALWCGFGLVFLVSTLNQLVAAQTRRVAPVVLVLPAFSVIAIVLSVLPFAQSRAKALEDGIAGFVQENYPMPFYNLDEPHDRAERLATALPDNAILFTDWDLLYALYYVAHLEQGRTGMAFHETYPQSGVGQLAESAFDYIESELIAGRPVYVQERLPELRLRYRLHPQRTDAGRLWQVLLHDDSG